MSTGLREQLVQQGQTKSGALALRLGGKKRFETALLRFYAHTDASIEHR